MTPSMKWVTFLCPSRGRPESLRKSIKSLTENAWDPTCFDVLVYVDDDDPRRSDYSHDEHTIIVRGPRVGYARLHECIGDALIPAATGTWLWLWNDDALMQTKHWDLVLHRFPVNMVGNPDTNHQSHANGLNVFPVVPRAWVDLVGWARNGANDTWWQYIGQHLGAQCNIPVRVLHDRSDLTGGHKDDTRAGNDYDSATFYAQETQDDIKADALRIREVFRP